jgi:hypothetical protein
MLISLTLKGVANFFWLLEEGLFHPVFSAFWITSSTTVFHSRHPEHWPTHLAYWVPQFWQKKAVFVLAMKFCWILPKDKIKVCGRATNGPKQFSLTK